MRRQIKKPALLTTFFVYAIVVFIAALSLSGIFGWRVYYHYTDQLEQRLDSQSGRIERTFSDTIDHTAYVMKVMIEQIKKNPENQSDIDNILSKFKTKTQAENLLAWTIFSWINKDYQITVDALYGIMDPPFDLSIRDYVPLTRQEPNKMHLGESVYGSTSNRWMIPGGIGATDSEGNYIGAMVIGFDIVSLTERMKKASNLEGIKFSLLNEKFYPVLKSNERMPEMDIWLQGFRKNLEERTFALEPKQKYFTTSLLEGHNHYLIHIKNYPYYLYLSYDSNLVSHELWSSLFSRVLEIVVFAIVVMGLLVLLYRRLVQPIIALSHTADAIAAGKHIKCMPRSSAYETMNLAVQLSKLQKAMHRERQLKEQLAVAMETAKESGKIRERFMRKLHHQMKTPLNILISTLELFTMERIGKLKAPIEDKEAVKLLKTAYQAVQQLQSSITDTVYVTKVEPQELLKECTAIQMKEAIEKNIRIEEIYAKNLKPIYTDEIKFKQVFAGLLARVLEFAPSDIIIRMEARVITKQKKKYLQVTIEDNGFGFDNITRQYWIKEQEKYGLSRRPDGVNLPPQILEKLLDYLDGTVTYKDKVTQGSCATVLIPYKKHSDFKPKTKTVVPTPSSSGNVVSFRRDSND